jgi:hypothetical protein
MHAFMSLVGGKDKIWWGAAECMLTQPPHIILCHLRGGACGQGWIQSS